MCRLAFFPPGFKRNDALDILVQMYGNDEHEHGVGEAYVKNGEIIVNKYGLSLKKIIKKNKPFLNHLPYSDGWTIAHLRKQSIGEISKDNAHPHLSMDKKVAVVHNGTIGGTGLLSIYLQTCLGYKGSSDSAAITEVISRIGVKSLAEILNWGGVIGALNVDGSLKIAKVSGQLSLHLLENKTLLMASELNDDKYKNIELTNGYFHLDRFGKYVSHVVKKFEWNGYKKEEPVIAYEDWRGVHYQSGQTAAHGAVAAGVREFPYDSD